MMRSGVQFSLAAPDLIGFSELRTGDAKDDIEIPVTVSYTHLRAHETKANLVCRLLLEKKKI